MGVRMEWRCGEGLGDAVLAVEEDTDVVLGAWEGNQDELRDFLNDMAGLVVPQDGSQSHLKERGPEQWGDLVLARSGTGAILSVDPGLYWDRVQYWFRSRGDDPHPWRKRRQPAGAWG